MGVRRRFENSIQHESDIGILPCHCGYVSTSVWGRKLSTSKSSSSVGECTMQNRVCRSMGYKVCRDREPTMPDCTGETMQHSLQEAVCAYQRQECQTVYKSVCNTEYQQVC